MMKKLNVFVAGLIVAFSAAIALAESEGKCPDRPRSGAKSKPRIRRPLKGQLPEGIRELMKKRKSGEELTDDEKAKLKKFMMRHRPRRRRRPKAEEEGTE